MSEIKGEGPSCSLAPKRSGLRDSSAVREAYLVAREQNVIVSQEALAEDIGECVIFFIEEEDTCVRCACCG